MSVGLFGAILRRIAQTAVQFAVKQGLESGTGADFESIGEVTIEILQEQFDVGPSEATSEQVAQAAREAIDTGRITQQQVRRAEKQAMTDFNSFMSIGLNQCGSDRETFAALVEVWNREKDDIRTMTQAEVRQNLTCP